MLNRCLPALCILICLALPARAQESANLRFERLDPQTGSPTGWTAGVGSGPSGIQPGLKLYADSLIRQEGRYALSMEYSGTGDFVSVVQTIPGKLDAGTIRLSGYMRTADVIGTAGLWMRIDGRSRMLAFENMRSRPVSGTTDWKEYTIELPYNKEEAIRINVGALLSGTGRIWIDNFRISLDGKDLAAVAAYNVPLLPADKDTAHFNGSGIADIDLTQEKAARLATLGALWGFIKYYHSGVQEGNHNMDAQLFRFLPMVLAAKDNAQALEFMERWVDMFGKPAPCTTCKDTGDMGEIALRPDYGILFRKGALPQSLVDKLDYIRRNRSRGGQQHYYIDKVQTVGNPDFRNEHSYAARAYPDAGTRLLTLYRYWNMIQYFFPDRHLIGEDWNKVLPDMIPDFVNAGDTAAYQLSCLKLIARIHDTHANIWGGAGKLHELKGTLITPFRAQFIEDKLVVTGYYKDTLGIREHLQPGDVIERIAGTAVDSLVLQYLPLTPASNRETQLRDMASSRGFLLRSNVDEVLLGIVRNGNRLDVGVRRIPVEPRMAIDDNALFRPEEGYRMLPGNIGYIYPARLSNASLDSIKALFAKTKGLIIDLRCYPTTFMPFTYGEWLKPAATPFVRFTTGSTDIPGLFTRTAPISNGRNYSNFYPGKVVLIVNTKTQSQAEYTAMALQTVPGAVTIGSTTAGADGNVSEIILPGGIRTMISGIGVLYPDGTETQRKGIRIDRVVRPTIKGIRDGKDELLDAAIRIIR